MKIRDIFVEFSKSVYESRVFKMSSHSKSLQQKCGDIYIIGDTDYPLQGHLITPFENRRQLTSLRCQTNYSTVLS